MPISLRVPGFVAADARSHGIWFEEEVDLGNDLVERPDDFWQSAQAVAEFVGYGADVVTVTVASIEVGAFLRRALARLRGEGGGQSRATIKVEAPGFKGTMEIDLDTVDDNLEQTLVTLLRSVSGEP